jgi:hypothetical protein
MLSDTWTRSFHAINETLMTLIPKTAEAKGIKDYNPISLIHCLGKIFSKVLASRLAPRLASHVHSTQSTFIKALSLMLFMLVMEVLNAMIRKANSWLLYQQLWVNAIPFMASLYANDLIMCVTLATTDLHITQTIFALLEGASGLALNMGKCQMVRDGNFTCGCGYPTRGVQTRVPFFTRTRPTNRRVRAWVSFFTHG